MKKCSGSSLKLGSFLSSEAPNYRDKSIGSQKGWSSERVLLQPSSSSIRHCSVANLTPFNSGRTIPSKWDDAERWICSPVSGDANDKTNSYAQLQRRPKSKSGPIVPPGTGHYNFSPTIPLRQGLVMKNFMMGGSPFSTGVLAPDAISFHHYCSHDAVFGPRYEFDNSMQCSSPMLNQNSVALSSVSSAPLWSELLCGPSSPNSEDEKRNENKNEDVATSPLSKCDKANQMSPPETEDDAPKSSPTSTMDQQNSLSAKLEVRDVEIDSEATIIRWSKNHVPKLSLLPGKHSRKSSSTETKPSGLNIADSTLDSSKIQREEAKIIAWESLQKAKAEAAIRKLEMKLEKKKSSSMDKILNKLRRAQMKAEKMRNQITVEEGQQVSKTPKVLSFHKYAYIWYPRSCFSTHAR